MVVAESLSSERRPRSGACVPRPPDIVANSYRLLRRLAAGGMADVYEAEHVRLGNVVAVKILRQEALESAANVARFRQEAKLLAQLDDEHVVGILDCGELADGTPFLVMERLQGEDLRQALARAVMTLPRALGLVLDASRGLAAVHGAGLVHRDIKPSNLFVTELPNGQERCKLLDFGVAKQHVSASTQEGTLVGTLRYMAPEQLENAAAATAASDVYSMAAVLYECLAGSPLHRAETVQELMAQILGGDGCPADRPLAVPAAVGALLTRALRREPAQRPANAIELVDELERLFPQRACERCVSDVTSSTRDENEPRLERRRRRPWSALPFGVAMLGSFALGSLLSPLEGGEQPLARPTGESCGPAAQSRIELTAAPVPVAEPKHDRPVLELERERAEARTRASTSAVQGSTPKRPLRDGERPAAAPRGVSAPTAAMELQLEERNPYAH